METEDKTWKNDKGEIRPLFRRDKELTPEQNYIDAAAHKAKFPGMQVKRKKPYIDLSQLRTDILAKYEPKILTEKSK